MSFVHFDEIYEMCCEVSESRMEEPFRNPERKATFFSPAALPVRRRKKVISSTVPKSKMIVYNP